MSVAFHGGNLPFLKRIGGRGLIGLKSIRIRRTSNRIRSFGKKRYIIRIVYNYVIKGRLDSCFGGV
jgi:hypothetical protein